MSDKKGRSSKIVSVAGAGAIGVSALFARGLSRMATLVDDAVRLGSRPAIGTADDFAAASRFSAGTADDFAMSSRIGMPSNAGTTLFDDAGNAVTNLDDVLAPEAFADEMIAAGSGSSRTINAFRANTRNAHGITRVRNSAKRFGDGLGRGQDALDILELATEGEPRFYENPISAFPNSTPVDLSHLARELERQKEENKSTWSPVYSGRCISIELPAEQLESLKKLSERSSVQIDAERGRILVELNHDEFEGLISTGKLDQNAVRAQALKKIYELLKSDSGNTNQ